MDTRRAARILAKLVKRQRGICAYCARNIFIPKDRGEGARKPNEATLDHVLPRADGHSNVGNLVAACAPCNNAKGPLDGATFRKLREKPDELKAAVRAKSIEVQAVRAPVYARAAASLTTFATAMACAKDW